MFSREFCEIFQNSIFIYHLYTIAITRSKCTRTTVSNNLTKWKPWHIYFLENFVKFFKHLFYRTPEKEIERKLYHSRSQHILNYSQYMEILFKGVKQKKSKTTSRDMWSRISIHVLYNFILVRYFLSLIQWWHFLNRINISHLGCQSKVLCMFNLTVCILERKEQRKIKSWISNDTHIFDSIISDLCPV